MADDRYVDGIHDDHAGFSLARMASDKFPQLS